MLFPSASDLDGDQHDACGAVLLDGPAELHQRRELVDARLAPGRPEMHQRGPVEQRGQLDPLAVGDRGRSSRAEVRARRPRRGRRARGRARLRERRVHRGVEPFFVRVVPDVLDRAGGRHEVGRRCRDDFVRRRDRCRLRPRRWATGSPSASMYASVIARCEGWPALVLLDDGDADDVDRAGVGPYPFDELRHVDLAVLARGRPEHDERRAPVR